MVRKFKLLQLGGHHLFGEQKPVYCKEKKKKNTKGGGGGGRGGGCKKIKNNKKRTYLPECPSDGFPPPTGPETTYSASLLMGNGSRILGLGFRVFLGAKK